MKDQGFCERFEDLNDNSQIATKKETVESHEHVRPEGKWLFRIEFKLDTLALVGNQST